MFAKLLFIAIVSVYLCDGTVLLWSKNKLAVSPLKAFNDASLENLVQELGYPELSVYKISSEVIPNAFKKVLEGYHSAYVANGEISAENSTELVGLEDFDLLKLKQRLESSDSNTLSVLTLIQNNQRLRREAPLASSSSTPSSSSASISSSSSTPLSSDDYPYNVPTGPVFYKGESVTDKTFGLLYSSQPLLLKTVNGSRVYLGVPPRIDMITVDTKSRESYARLNINIPIEDDNKVTLRFKFLLSSSGYWSLSSVKISDTNRLFAYNLSVQQDVQAPARFSYHCSGVTLFADAERNAELYVYDLQVQIDSVDGKFDDAYDCVNFTTVPIWSGLMVMALLGVGFVVAMVAIVDIKTMDKFDNQKTKNLAITVAE